MKKTPATYSALALLAVLASCQGPNMSQRSQNTYRASEGSFEIEKDMGSILLGDGVELKNARSHREDGRLLVDLDLVNSRNHKTRFEWRVEWFDNFGEPVKVNTPWRPTVLAASATKHLVLVAPTDSSTTWQLATRTPNNLD